MLFISVGQFWVALIFLWVGFCAALLDEIPRFFINKYQNKIIMPILDIFRCIFIGVIFILCTYFVCFGEIRLYEILFFSLGFAIERKILLNLVAKLFINLYNYTVIKIKNRKEKLDYAKKSK